jgi:hypothetical protein
LLKAGILVMRGRLVDVAASGAVKVIAGVDACEMRLTAIIMGDFDIPSDYGSSTNS